MKKENAVFTPKAIDSSLMAEKSDVDLNALYERASSELGLQQTKRDQIITLYLAVFHSLCPLRFLWRACSLL